MTLDEVRREVTSGSLRHAEALLAAGPFCEPGAAALLRARVLLDLGRTQQAEPALGGAHGAGAEVAALRAEIVERTRPRSVAERGQARDLLRRAYETRGSWELYAGAWKLDPPNGLALIGAGLAARSHGHGREDEQRAARFLERGVAELEEETGSPAHAGIAAPPSCVGHFSNYLRATWLADSAHALIVCNDGVVVARLDPQGFERVAQTTDAPSVDAARLPRLVILPPPRDQAGDDVETDRVRLRDGSWSARARVGERAWFQRIERSRDGKTVFGIAEGHETWTEDGRIFAFDGASGRVVGQAPGSNVRELDDGRFAVSRLEGVDIVDRTLARKRFIPGPRGEISPDGKRLLFTRVERGDEMYHPVYPWLRDLATGVEMDLRPLLARGSLHPASLVWQRLSPVQADDCARLGTMTARCAHPAVTIGGRAFGSSDEVACERLGERRDDRAFACLDPRGPVETVNPWDPSLVCRVGPHVLPLGACAHLLAPRQ